MELVRTPAVAGAFYPADRAELSSLVGALLREAEGLPDGQPRSGIAAIVAPHAGYVYSGPTAAIAYSAISGHGFEQVVVAGPCHYVGTPFVALAGAQRFRTPLGELPLWELGAQRAQALSEVITSPEVHEREHSLEVHFPFIQVALGSDVPILPLAVGWTHPQGVAAVLRAVWQEPETLLVISSDLSHYLSYEQAVTQDQETIDQVRRLDGPLRSDQACGVHPLNGLLELAPERGLTVDLLDYRNSGDTAGDRHRVVGYTALAFSEPAGHSNEAQPGGTPEAS